MLIRDGRVQTPRAMVIRRKFKGQGSDNGKISQLYSGKSITVGMAEAEKRNE